MPKRLKRLTLKAFPGVLSLGLGFLAFSLPLAVLADNEPGLSGGSFGSVLPQSGLGSSSSGVFSQRAPFSEMLNSGRAGSGSESIEDFSVAPVGASSAEPNSEPASISLDNPRAWYKFLEPSLNLARALEESERKRILSVVPMPLNLRKKDNQKEEFRVALLRAGTEPNYACFKTVYGGLYGRSDAVVLVESGKNVRILNLNGKEKDVLFKLSNGQVITIGPGSEMLIGKSLSAHELNAQDAIARRGITKPLKCNELQMSFSQFSYESVMKLPELQFFTKYQKPNYLQALAALIDRINEIRGVNGFRMAISPEEQSLARQNRPASRAAALKPPETKKNQEPKPRETPVKVVKAEERKETQVKQASQVKKETVAKIKKNPVTK
ncbi:MAG: hypothetical protein K2X27_26450, partial [Candidatus Obscuribacterales bacterium]|nr:hypothetical protein [Candidatus Obscuribacterales bacterium]